MVVSRSENRWSDLGVRSAAVLVLAPLVLFCVFWGGIVYFLLLVVIGAGAAREWCALVHGSRGNRGQFGIHVVSVVGGLLACYLDAPVIAMLVVAVCWGLSVFLAHRNGETGFWQTVGVPYVSGPLFALHYLRFEPDSGFLAVLWLLLVVWTTDTFAYFAGRLIGGPGLTRFSPNKTWAGLGGGVLGAGLASAAVGILIELPVVWIPVLLAAIVAVVSQVGDVFESAAKRHFGVKDSGSLIPGHGGILDRIDGLMFAAVFCVGLELLRGGDLDRAGRFLFW